MAVAIRGSVVVPRDQPLAHHDFTRLLLVKESSVVGFYPMSGDEVNQRLFVSLPTCNERIQIIFSQSNCAACDLQLTQTLNVIRRF